jgi:hypothetical protein
MTRRGIPIDELPAHLRRRAIARFAQSELGPDSPLLETPKRKQRDPGPEHAEQVKVVAWADDPETRQRFPELDALYSIPNESFGKRDGGDKKARGRRKGMPDLCLPVARRAQTGGIYGACYLEMKDLTGSVRESQLERIAILRARGNYVDVALSAESAIAQLTYYLSLPKP